VKGLPGHRVFRQQRPIDDDGHDHPPPQPTEILPTRTSRTLLFLLAVLSIAPWAPAAPGIYALSVLQDMNGNRKLDTNFIGIPTEHSGSSNDAPARFNAPRFKDAVFTVGGQPLELRIDLN